MTASQVSSNLFCYHYDAQGRRLEREDYDSTGNLLRTTRYLYQGWNCVAEFEASSSAGLSPAPSAFTRTRTYTWGLDLSQSKQGAGGVGGLCAITDETGAEDLSYHYASDGNGNIVGLYDDSFTAVAEYEYSPFGELIGQNGPYAEENPYRFSTKYQNEYLGGLHYYGYRYYDASTGRWPSRDPIGEEGGLNLYGFVGNSPLTFSDVLGLNTQPEHGIDYFGAEGPGFLERHPNGWLGAVDQAGVDRLHEAARQAEYLKDIEGNQCYRVIIRVAPLNANGVRNWGDGVGRAILVAHTTEGEPGNAPRQTFNVMTDGQNVSNDSLQPNCSVYGCHIQVGGISQGGALRSVVDEIRALEVKKCCKPIEVILIGTGTL